MLSSNKEKGFDFTFYYLKYSGGGDWYEGKVGAQNLMNFINSKKALHCNPFPKMITLKDSTLFEIPFLYLTGHGNISFDNTEKKNLKKYLENGGFLYVNDDYGIDLFFKKEIKNIYKNKKWITIPNDHLIFNLYYTFPKGAPKIHKHDGGEAETYGMFHEGRMIIFYTKNTDIGDGWASYQLHKNPLEKREAALKFGMNIILFSLTQ